MNNLETYAPYITAAVTSFIIAIVLMPAAISLLTKLNVLDIPNQRKVHKKPIPRMGGIVIYLAFATPVVIITPENIQWQGIIFGSGIALLIGCADDIWGVPAVAKLLALFALTLFIWHFGIITNLPVPDFLGIKSPGLHTIFNLLITMLWLTGVCSAVNAMDHLDGLAGSVSLTATLAYLAVSLQSHQLAWAIISLALIGSLLGFLCFNTHPARIFMGDSGSFFLGFSLASIGIMGGWSPNPIKAAVIPIAVLSVFIFDLCFVILVRKFNGTTRTIPEAIRYCGKDHIGHRLTSLGFSQSTAVFIVCMVASAIAISALVIRHTLFWESLLLLIQIFMVYIILAVFMEIATLKTIKLYYINRKQGRKQNGK